MNRLAIASGTVPAIAISNLNFFATTVLDVGPYAAFGIAFGISSNNAALLRGSIGISHATVKTLPTQRA